MRDKIIKNRLKNIHPGEILLEEFLKPLGLTSHRLSVETGLDPTRISLITKGKRSITADTALRLAKFFEGTTPGFWINMQTRYDLEEKEREIEKELNKIHSYKEVCTMA
jgi:addiction module HigA family antidote